jgi:HSP20 family protein
MSLIPRSSIFDMDNFFDNPWMGLSTGDTARGTAFSPRVDVRENADGYEIAAELPGINKDDVNVTLNNGILSIQAESRQEDTEEKNGRVIRQERRYGKFVRSFDLGNQVQDSDIKANFSDGVLKLHVPKASTEVEKTKRIEIQ